MPTVTPAEHLYIQICKIVTSGDEVFGTPAKTRKTPAFKLSDFTQFGLLRSKEACWKNWGLLPQGSTSTAAVQSAIDSTPCVAGQGNMLIAGMEMVPAAATMNLEEPLALQYFRFSQTSLASQLGKAIPLLVLPAKWEENGGHCEIFQFENRLAILADKETCDAVRDFLTRLGVQFDS